jgi:hypothetical protein
MPKEDSHHTFHCTMATEGLVFQSDEKKNSYMLPISRKTGLQSLQYCTADICGGLARLKWGSKSL